MKKGKIISGILCAAVVLICLFFYTGYASELYYDICTPYAYPMIEGFETVILEEMPEGYLLPDYVTADIHDMKVVEITYSLKNTINDTMGFLGYLCYYYGENGEWIDKLNKDEDYWGVRNYENCNILPPGEHGIFKEYIVVPKDMKEISAQRIMGESEDMMTIKLR